MITIDPNRIQGPVKPIHGVNLGPIDKFWSLDFSETFRELGIPSVRTHDANLTVLDTGDLHTIFPDSNADPDDPASYRFTQTDDYLKAIVDTGAEIYFRLGEAIEHQPHKEHIRAERWPDPARLARVCVNIARHYNQGWADGHEWGIEYWEFWNEPEGANCWGGTPEQFLNLYRAVAPAMKADDPSIKIGLAGFASPFFAWEPEEYEGKQVEHPYRSVLLRAVAEKLPIDFVSWHRYPAEWQALITAARRVRRFLDNNGLRHAESHLTEWAWNPTLPNGMSFMRARKTKPYENFAKALKWASGPCGAAFILGALAHIDDLPVDLAHFYTGVASLRFGLFEGLTGVPRRSIVGFETFVRFVGKQRMAAESEAPNDLAVIAAYDGRTCEAAIAHPNPETKELVVRIAGSESPHVTARQFTEDGWNDVPVSTDDGALKISLAGGGITLLQWNV